MIGTFAYAIFVFGGLLAQSAVAVPAQLAVTHEFPRRDDPQRPDVHAVTCQNHRQARWWQYLVMQDETEYVSHAQQPSNSSIKVKSNQ